MAGGMLPRGCSYGSVVLPGYRDLLDVEGVSQSYLTVKPFQCAVDHLQMAAAAYACPPLRVCNL